MNLINIYQTDPRTLIRDERKKRNKSHFFFEGKMLVRPNIFLLLFYDHQNKEPLRIRDDGIKCLFFPS